MKKFTENINSDDPGHRDNNGTWVPESLCASLRNKLNPLFSLSTMINNYETTDEEIKEKLLEYIKEEAKNCEKNKSIILEIIKKLEVGE